MTDAPPRSARWLHRALAGLVLLAAAGVLAGALLAWRLARGAIDLAFLVPSFERALAGPLAPSTVRIAAVELIWDRGARRPALHARDVRLLAPDGEALAVIPILALEPSLHALLSGTFAPRRIELIGAQLRVVRTPEGRFDLSFGARGQAKGHDVLRRLHATREGPAAWLQRVELRDGEAVLADPSTGATWHAFGVHLVAARTADALVLSGNAAFGAARVPLWIDAVYRTEPPAVDATVRFERLVPAAGAMLASSEPARAALARVELPLDGTLRVALDGDLGLRRIRLDAESGPGRVAVPELPAPEIAMQRLRLAATYDPAADTLDVETLAFDLGTTRGDVRGRLAELRDARRFDVTANIASLPAGDLAAWWPPGLGAKARDWVVTRISRGTVREAALHVTGRAPEGRFVTDAVGGTAAFDGLTVRYLDALPPARALAGTMTLKDGRWQFRLARGAVEDIDLVHGSVDVDAATRGARVDVALRGPVATALRLATLSGAAGDLGFAPDGVRGVVRGNLRLDVPFRRRPRSEDLNVTVSARLSDVAVARAFRTWSFSSGELDLDLRGRTLHVAGRGRLEGAPVNLVWHEDGEGAGRRRRVDVAGRFDAPTRAALGLDSRPWLDGPIDTRVRLVEQAGSGTLDIDTDLADASLEIPVLAVSKAPGSSASAAARVTIARGLAAGVERFDFAAGGASVTARATFGRDGRSFRTLDAAATIAARDAGRPSGRVTLALRPAVRGNAVVVTSDDAGALFRALGDGADASGGRLRYAGTLNLEAPDDPIDGRLELRDFTLRRAPTLARVATLGSLSGIATALESGGIRFDRLDAAVGHRGTTVTIADGLLRGPSLGLLVAGTIDRSSRIAALRGTLVPSYYGLNTLPGRVPVLGGVLAGKGREGVQAIDFTIAGPLDAPRVSVSPASLAPGALRDLVRRLGTDRP